MKLFFLFFIAIINGTITLYQIFINTPYQRVIFLNMYGNLQEISINNLLQLIENEQKSGVLFIESSCSTTELNHVFLIFCCLGKIVYVADNDSFSLRRIHDFLCHYHLENSLSGLSEELISPHHIPEYEAILVLGKQQIISNHQAKKILYNIIYESIFNLLFISKGSFFWHENYKLQPQINRISISNILQKLTLQHQLWLQFYPYINFANQCPVIKDQAKLKATLNQNIYETFCQLIDGKTSLIKLSRYLNKDLVTISKAIYPCVEMGWIKLLDNVDSKNNNNSHLESRNKNKNKNIIFLTKDINWTSSLKILLKNKEYDLFVTYNLDEGFNLIFNNHPNLIILEKDVFYLSSDEFCQIIRNKKELFKTPIIIITNNYEFIDSLKHQIVGATEYVTKAEITENFLNMIEDYLEKEVFL